MKFEEEEDFEWKFGSEEMEFIKGRRKEVSMEVRGKGEEGA